MDNQNQPVFNQLPGQKNSHASLIVAIIMSVLFLSTLVFAIWAFIGMQDNQTNLDAKIETASEKAVKTAEAAKEAEFTERLKDPYKSFKGSQTYGSLQFEYPKSWSVYAEEDGKSTLLDFYAHPDIIPGFDDTNFAFRAQIINKEYADELKTFDTKAKNGKVKVSAFRPDNVEGQLGAVIEGEIDTKTQGTLILLPQRDKTVRLFTESEDYDKDFARIIKSVTYIP